MVVSEGEAGARRGRWVEWESVGRRGERRGGGPREGEELELACEEGCVG